MEKALEHLQERKNYLYIVEHTKVAMSDLENIIQELVEINEAIEELEEAMKPKSCEGCKYRSHLDESLTNKTTNGFCVENGFFTRHGFCCNRHEPKDNA